MFVGAMSEFLGDKEGDSQNWWHNCGMRGVTHRLREFSKLDALRLLICRVTQSDSTSNGGSPNFNGGGPLGGVHFRIGLKPNPEASSQGPGLPG